MDDKNKVEIPSVLKGFAKFEPTPAMLERMKKDEEEKKIRERWLDVLSELPDAPAPCRFFAPECEDGKKYPLVLFLHGAGERGIDNRAQILANDGANVWIREQLDGDGEKCFVLAPQCPESEGVIRWDDGLCRDIMKLIDGLTAKYPIDPNRLYVTGLSMGGRGCFNMLRACPGRFAATAPFCPAILTGATMDAMKVDDGLIAAFAEAVGGYAPVAVPRCGRFRGAGGGFPQAGRPYPSGGQERGQRI